MTNTSNDELYQLALRLASDPQGDVLELGGALARLLDRDRLQFKELLGVSGLTARRAYILVAISRAFDPLALPRKRLQALGWVKLQALAGHIDAGNAEALLKMAETHSAAGLRGLLSRNGLALGDGEKAEVALINAANRNAGGQGRARRRRYEKEEPTVHVARMLVRVIGVRPWTDDDISQALRVMGGELKRFVESGACVLEPLIRQKPQKVLEVDLSPVTIKTPEDGYEARRQGFMAEENPFPKGTHKHKAWAAGHDHPDWIWLLR